MNPTTISKLLLLDTYQTRENKRNVGDKGPIYGSEFVNGSREVQPVTVYWFCFSLPLGSATNSEG
jgi:hypothetical protein